MKSKLPFGTVLMVVASAASVTNTKVSPTFPPTASNWPTTAVEWTTERPVRNLKGKMFTLSSSGQGRISLHQPFLSPPSPRSGYPATTYPPWTTSEPHRGVSVCLRYTADVLQTRSSTIFTLSPNSTPLTLGVTYGSQYWLSSDRYTYKNLYLTPSIRISSHVRPEIWTAVCLMVDTRRNVAQMFSGSSMSIRKFLPNPYVWSGNSEIVLSGFDGQVTDVQVWDYPLRYPQVHNYMTGGAFMPYRGSVISWSYVAYSLGGKVQLEDTYEWQETQLVSSRGRGRRLRKKSRRGGSNEVGRL